MSTESKSPPLQPSKKPTIFLKVRFERPGPDELLYRTLEVEPTITVTQVIREIKQKYGYTDSRQCIFRMYKPPEEKSDTMDPRPECDIDGGMWLDGKKSLNEYIQPDGYLNTILEFKNCLRPLKVTDLDESNVKTVPTLITGSLELLMKEISLRFSISNSLVGYGFQICRKGKNIWLSQDIPLHKQIMATDPRIFIRKQYFSNNDLRTRDPYALHLLYLECRQGVVSGFHPTSLDQALRFSALQMQITYGNYDPLEHVAGFFNTSEFLPEQWRETEMIEEDVYKQHRQLKGLNEAQGKYQYVKLLKTFPTYGLHYISVCEKLESSGTYDHQLCVGVNSESLLCLHPDTKKIITKYSIHLVEAFKSDGKKLQWKFGSKFRKFECENEEEAKSIVDMANGYLKILNSKRHKSVIHHGKILTPRGIGDKTEGTSSTSVFTKSDPDTSNTQKKIRVRSHTAWSTPALVDSVRGSLNEVKIAPKQPSALPFSMVVKTGVMEEGVKNVTRTRSISQETRQPSVSDHIDIPEKRSSSLPSTEFPDHQGKK